MAEVRAFKGVRYNLSKVGKLDDVVSQPYDKITDSMREDYYAKSEYNIVRIIKGKPEPGDSDTGNVYTRARRYLDRWLDEKILIQDSKPALYIYHQEFEAPELGSKTRKGFICKQWIVPPFLGTVRPHERTLSKPKEDRLNLMRATATNFGQIFLLYPDEKNSVYQMLEPFAQGQPEMEALEEGGVKHRVWTVHDGETIARVTEAMKDKSLYIADGHHRFETALDYLEERMMAAGASDTGEEPYNFRMVTLVGMEDPGLFILPTHRLIHSLRDFSLDRFLEGCSNYFDLKPASTLASALEEMKKAGEGHALGLYAGGEYRVLTSKKGSGWEKMLPASRSAEWKGLDVVILHEVVIQELLGISEEKVVTQENIRYLRDPQAGIKAVDSGDAQLLLLMNPTKVSQVKAVASKMEKMPQKSTDFFPKLISGLVMNPLT
ncbi:DUF1015 domain-containing protein [candidate division TA06 bacterium]|uniref:DUF1015 domain-containing protein n=1 Tax=candidate division TA06 bacterium TaxID=2250710 RepID=A0A523UZ82_UNCT6|nr:MAG: DUF1015 domain-containing protein [candidate division TA06 bacterium]